jgi:hypothetical protein
MSSDENNNRKHEQAEDKGEGGDKEINYCWYRRYLAVKNFFYTLVQTVQGNGLISPRRYREKGSIFGQKIENSWFSPKNTGDL